LLAGTTDRQLERAIERGQYVRLAQGVYFKGDRHPTDFERRLAVAMRFGKPVSGKLAAALHGFDGFSRPRDGLYDNIVVTDIAETLHAIAATTTDAAWEQALEWCLRKHEVSITDIEVALKAQRYGNGRIRRVLELRPHGAPPTESIMETIAVQLLRCDPTLPTPTRQLDIRNVYGEFQGRVDLAFPSEGAFFELDGQQHKGQPIYDANRQTRIVSATGWLVGRFTWDDVVRNPKSTLRRMGQLFDTARSIQRAS